MAIANVALSDTFDQWRVKTNQLIVQGDQTLTLVTDANARANAQSNTVNAAFGVANTANIISVAAFVQANTGRDLANTANTIAVAAFAKANIGYDQAVAVQTIATAAFTKANSACTSADTATSVATAAQSAAITAQGQAAAAFNQANTAYGQANAAYGQANAAYGAANTSSNTAIAAFAKANSIISGPTVANEVTSAATHYVVLTTTTSGNLAQANVATTKLTFTPSTGTLGATIFNSLSDIQQKTNISTVVGALDKLNSMRGVTFNWAETNEPSMGVIAQEVESVTPELVYTNEDGIKSVNYAGFTALLIEAIKELQKRIDILENK